LSGRKILKADFCDLRTGEILKKPIFEGLRERKSKGRLSRLVSCTARPLPALLYFASLHFLRRGCGVAPRINAERMQALKERAGKI